MKKFSLVLAFAAAAFAMLALEAPTIAGCGSASGTGLFGGGGLFRGNGPISRMRARFADRRASRQNATQTSSFSSTYTTRAIVGGYGQAVRYNAGYMLTIPQAPAAGCPCVTPPQAPAPIPNEAAPKISQAPPTTQSIKLATTPARATRSVVLFSPTTGFSVSSDCANGRCQRGF